MDCIGSLCLFLSPLGIKQLSRRPYIHSVHFIYISSLFKHIKDGPTFSLQVKKKKKKSLLHTVDADQHRTNKAKYRCGQ